MTHITGPRARVVDRLATNLMRAIQSSKATTSESFEAIHEVQMTFVHQMLKPFEDDCPTCPKGRRK